MIEDPIYGMRSIVLVTILMIASFLSYFIASKLNQKRSPGQTNEKAKDFGPIQSALFGLFALILAFTFSMSAGKYEKRKDIIVQEANNIGTAILRCDLYPDSLRKEFRKDFRDYLDARIAYFDAEYDNDKIEEANKKTEKYYLSIWKRACEFGRNSQNMVMTNQMIPALNDMIDITTTRESARIDHIPEPVILLLFTLCITTTFILGFFHTVKKSGTIDLILLIIMTSITIYTILDLDKPRRGIITVEKQNQKIVELKKMLVD